MIVIPVENEEKTVMKRVFGSGKDRMKIHEPFYETPDDFREYM